LRAHLLATFRDLPAIAKFLEFLGHNARYPCRFCLIIAIQGVTAKGGTHLYCPLHRPDGSSFDPLHLPLHTHEECLARGFEVLEAPSENAQNTRATESGIKGVSLLARLPSVSIPASFPIDIMHMVWINLVPQIIQLWTEQFNKLNDGVESYAIHPVVWQALGSMTEDSGSTIPTSFGCHVPNLAKSNHTTAEAWSVWATLIAPSLLRRRFRKAKYYVHFVQLVKLLNRCTSFSLPRREIAEIQEGFASWVTEYEQ
jgi:hypothetical protein